MVKKNIQEVNGSDGQSVVADPVNTGNPHANRALDQANGESAPNYDVQSKAAALHNAVATLIQYSATEITDWVKGLDKSKNKRPLDQENGQSASPAKLAKEDLESLLDGLEDLSEDAKTALAAIFEAAVNTKLTIEKASLEEQFETKLTESVLEIRAELTEAVDQYLTEATKTWLEENEVALASNLKVQIAENLINSVRNLVSENSFALPENVDVVEDLTNRNADLQEQLSEMRDQLASLSESVLEHEVNDIFNGLTEDLALTQVERLRDLAENIEYKSADEFQKKFAIVFEAFTDKKPVNHAELNEENPGEGEQLVESTAVNSTVAYLSRKKNR